MAPLVSTIEIARPPDEVFAFATDPRNFPDWQRDVVRVQMVGDSQFTTTRRFAGAERTLTQEITHNDPPHSWAAEGVDDPIRAHAKITAEPIDDGARTRITFALDFAANGLAAPLMPLVHRQAEKGAPHSYQNLKELLEGKADRGRRSDVPRHWHPY
jgi:uncharacterized protein YndB with AHSA1/START domain